MATLLQLPIEILFMIAYASDTRGLCSLRLASRDLNAITLPGFSKRCFETRFVMLQQYSLDNLVDISRHPVFGPAVRTLTICIDHLTEWPADTIPIYFGDSVRRHELVPWSAEQSPRVSSADMDPDGYKRRLEEQKHLLESGLATIYLAEAMAALHNLRAVVVDNAYRPWGATTLTRQTGFLLTNVIVSGSSIEFVKHALRAIVTAIAANNRRLFSLDIAPASWDILHGDGIGPDMLVFPSPVVEYVRSYSISIASLTLLLCPRSRRTSPAGYVADLMGFITLFPNLRRLALEFDPRDTHSNFPELSRTLRLPHLRSLSLRSIQCTEAELAEFLLGHKSTLEHAYLSAVDIMCKREGWQSLLTTIGDEVCGEGSARLLLTINQCLSVGQRVYYRQGQGDDAAYLETFQIGRSRQDWADTVEGIVVGRKRTGAMSWKSVMEP
jgi:hypothetical protein